MHCSCGVSHSPTYIACIPQLLHILITFLVYGLFLTLVCTVCCLPAHLPPLKSLGIPGQRHVKAIRQKVSEVFFSEHWGESERLQRSVTKTGRCCGSVLHTLLHWHTQTNPLVLIHRQTGTHGPAVTHTYNSMQYIHREYKVKANTRNPLSLCPNPLSLYITSLSAPLVPSRASSY